MMSLSHFRPVTSNDSDRVTVGNLLREIITVRDSLLTLPGWFECGEIEDIIFSVCCS